MSCCGNAIRETFKQIRYTKDKSMGECVTCGSENEYNNGTCDCCKLTDGDEKQKQVRWCTMCSAFICSECENDYPKRVRAFFNNAGNKIKELIKK